MTQPLKRYEAYLSPTAAEPAKCLGANFEHATEAELAIRRHSDFPSRGGFVVRNTRQTVTVLNKESPE